MKANACWTWEGEDEIIEEYEAFRRDLDGLSSTYNEFLKLGINDLMINQKRDVMNYWIHNILEINKSKDSNFIEKPLDESLFQLFTWRLFFRGIMIY
ncbi:hypothetical protein RRG54_01060 [Mycoplasmopsis felis]|uniref:hypothetical protein n=1 Tax=Mycoplasmopsis felis TaxID=33923 RepID=UPI00300D9EB1